MHYASGNIFSNPATESDKIKYVFGILSMRGQLRLLLKLLICRKIQGSIIFTH